MFPLLQIAQLEVQLEEKRQELAAAEEETQQLKVSTTPSIMACLAAFLLTAFLTLAFLVVLVWDSIQG